jgi:hypothetical protein
VPQTGDVHIVPADGKWRVEVTGEQQPRSIHERQSDAAAVGRQIAQRNQAELLIHGRDGQVRERNTYGHDPRSTPG